MRTRASLAIIALLGSIGSVNAVAQEQSGLYIGFSAGQSKVDIGDDDVPGVFGATASSVSTDETDTGFKIYIGHRFNRNFAIEGGWTDLGSFKATRNVTAPAAGAFNVEIEASGPHFDALGILPFQQLDIFGKLGVMLATTKTHFSTSGAVVLNPALNSSPKESELEFKVGVGASYSFTKNLGIRAEFERYLDVGTSETGEGDVDLISVGVTYRF